MTDRSAQRFLAVESSCDETSVAVIDGDGRILSNRIASQVREHARFGGVVPEVAARAHLQSLAPLLDESRAALGGSFAGVTAVGATAGPGLVGALLVGLHAAEGLAQSVGAPFFPINHLEGHIVSPFLRADGSPARPAVFPFLAVLLSGGHSALYLVREHWVLERLARTRDDAAGEAFDKVGKRCGLGYPAGPVVDRLAQQGDPKRFVLPRPRLSDGSLDFSFSGLKTAAIRELPSIDPGAAGAPSRDLVDLLAGFQAAVVDSVAWRVERAVEAHSPQLIAVSGGVAANRGLRARLGTLGAELGIPVLFPEGILAADNAAMIAMALALRYHRGLTPGVVRARSRWDPTEA